MRITKLSKQALIDCDLIDLQVSDFCDKITGLIEYFLVAKKGDKICYIGSQNTVITLMEMDAVKFVKRHRPDFVYHPFQKYFSVNVSLERPPK